MELHASELLAPFLKLSKDKKQNNTCNDTQFEIKCKCMLYKRIFMGTGSDAAIPWTFLAGRKQHSKQ